MIKDKNSTSIVVSNKIKRINAFEGYCEIVEKRIKKRELNKINRLITSSQNFPQNIQEYLQMKNYEENVNYMAST